MVWIPGSNNGVWGVGAARGALFPPTLNGPFGHKGAPLPVNLQLPTGVISKPNVVKSRRSFGNVYELTPGGVTTDSSWGFKDKAYKAFGRKRRRRGSRRRKSQRRGSRRRKSQRKSKSRRCKGVKHDGKRCKHRTTTVYCKHHKH